MDSAEALKIKGLIRRTEARSAAIHCGVPKENIFSLDLPFYETGAVKKNPITQVDIDIVRKLIV